MTRAQCLERGLDSAQQICNATTVTVSGLYLATHYVAVTALGTVATAALCGWSMWLACRNGLALPVAPRLRVQTTSTPRFQHAHGQCGRSPATPR
jgi:hypothetical protein